MSSKMISLILTVALVYGSNETEREDNLFYDTVSEFEEPKRTEEPETLQKDRVAEDDYVDVEEDDHRPARYIRDFDMTRNNFNRATGLRQSDSRHKESEERNLVLVHKLEEERQEALNQRRKKEEQTNQDEVFAQKVLQQDCEEEERRKSDSRRKENEENDLVLAHKLSLEEMRQALNQRRKKEEQTKQDEVFVQQVLQQDCEEEERRKSDSRCKENEEKDLVLAYKLSLEEARQEALNQRRKKEEQTKQDEFFAQQVLQQDCEEEERRKFSSNYKNYTTDIDSQSDEIKPELEDYEMNQCVEEKPKRSEFRVIPMDSDGNCLFRAIAYYVFKNPERHREIRRKIVKKMREIQVDPDIFGATTLERQSDEDEMLAKFKKQIDKSLNQFRLDYYLDDMAKDKTWGTEFCIQAARDLDELKLTIHVYNSQQKRWTTYKIAGGQEIFLEYTGNHYNVLVKKKQK